MVKLKYIGSALIGLALASCIPPKAVAVAEPPVQKKEKPPEPVATVPDLPTAPDDGLRMPDMLNLPSDGEFRTVPGPVKTGGEAGAVIARPPTEPPSRPKPKDDSSGGQR